MKKILKLKFIKAFATVSFVTFFNTTLASCANQPIIAQKMMYGNVVTLNEKNTIAEAVGIKDGKIVFVGSKNAAKSHIDDNTEIIDYGDNYIYPGFVDSHSHPAMLGAAITGGCLVTPDMNKYQTMTAFKEYIRQNPGKSLYKCYGSYASLKNGSPDHHYTYKFIDEQLKDLVDEGLLPDDAMVIMIDYGGHSGCLNGVGVKQLKSKFNNITEEDVKKLQMTDTIELEKLDEGHDPEINGNISETPAYAFYYSIPNPADEIKEGILAQQEMTLAQMGYTTLGDCGVQDGQIETVKALSELGAEGKLKFKVRAYYLIMETDNISAKDQVKKAIELAKQYNNEYFKIVGLKVFIDGVTEKESCYTTKEYVNPPEGYSDYYGVFRWSKQWRPVMEHAPQIRDIIAEANRNGLSVTSHSYGDGAVKFMLDEYAEARKQVKYDRNSISHCAYVLDEDVKRFNDLHVSSIVAPHWSVRTALGDNHDKNIFGDYDPQNPDERSIQKMYKIKTFIDSGENNHVAFHTDGMCPDGIPYMLYTAINRVDPDNADPNQPGYIGPRDEKEDVSVKEALKCMTSNPAYLLGEEKNIGSIQLKKWADFSIYPIDFTDPNTFLQSNYQVAHIKPIATYVNGNLAYSAN